MSDFYEATDPYRYEATDPYRASEWPASSQGPKTRTSGLTAISIITVVLGAAGLLAVTFGFVWMLAEPYVQQASAQAGAEGDEGPELTHLRMQREMNEINHRYRWYYIIMLATQLIVACLLLWGGIQAWRLKPGGAKLLVIACAAAIIFELLRGIGNVLLQVQMLQVMEEYLPELTAGSGGELGAKFVRISMYVGMAFGFVWLLGKIIFYGVSIAYLRKPKIQALFASTP